MIFRSVFRDVPLLCSVSFYSVVVNGQRTGSSFKAGVLDTDNIGLINSGNTEYFVNITVGGEEFTVQLDTGSTDLWVDGLGRNITLTNSTNISVNETYGIGSVFGNIAFTGVRLGDFYVPSQGMRTTDMDGTQGILGMAFDNAEIYRTLTMTWGKQRGDELGGAFITNVFDRNQSLPNNFDLQLGRATFEDLAGLSTFTISDHAPGFENVTQAPKLPRVAPDHWTVALDEMRIDGNPFTFNESIVPGAPEGKLLAVLDSGFSFPPLPEAPANAIYSKIPGAVLYKSPVDILNGWIIPCDFVPVNFSFTLGGREYPVHPLDLFLPEFVPIIDNGAEKNVTVCVATYRATTLDRAAGVNTFDLILGDAFLRNVYASHGPVSMFDYNDYNPMNNTEGQPFVQMVSTIDVHSAKTELYAYISSLRVQSPPFIEPCIFVTKPLSPSFTGAMNNIADAAFDIEFTVILDTGSTDLWIDGRGRNIKATNTTGISGNQSYAKGEVSGVISFAELKVGEHTVSSQGWYYLKYPDVENMSPGLQGILGMAFDTTSSGIRGDLGEKWGEATADKLGRSFIDNVFAQNKSLPNNFDVELGRRVLGISGNGNGTLIVASHSPQYESVTQAPKLPRVSSDSWSIYLDEMHVDGKVVPFNKSHVSNVPEGKVIAGLDTGFTLPPLPKGAVDAIYSNIPGAVLDNSAGWIIPCNTTKLPELSFVFSGKKYPVHPLDLFQLQEFAILDDGKNETVYECSATYQASKLDPAHFPFFWGIPSSDIIYDRFDYGDDNAANHTEGQPFVQMVSTVDPSAAQVEYKEFLQKIKDKPTPPPSELVARKVKGSDSN
ncbi:hypothetical protein V8D89_003198 [Ganoderma adspersum]